MTFPNLLFQAFMPLVCLKCLVHLYSLVTPTYDWKSILGAEEPLQGWALTTVRLDPKSPAPFLEPSAKPVVDTFLWCMRDMMVLMREGTGDRSVPPTLAGNGCDLRESVALGWSFRSFWENPSCVTPVWSLPQKAFPRDASFKKWVISYQK